VPRTTAHRTAVVLTGATAALAVLTLGLAVVLSFTYVPSGAQAWDDPTLGGGTAWTAWHRCSAVLWMLAGGASVVALAVLTATSDRRRSAIALGGAVVTGIAAVVALASRALVQWDQLALSAVTVGGGLDGYWPVFDDGVRFVLMDGVEVDPADYAVALAVHLLAHVIGAVAAVGSCALLVPKTAKAPGRSPGAFDESVCGFR
jgi:hypothetical protein